MTWIAPLIGAGGGILSSLAGGGGSSSSTKLSREHRKIRGENLNPLVESFAKNYGGGEGLYGDTRLDDQDPLIGQGQEQALRAAGQIGQGFSGANQALEGFLDTDYNSPQNQAQRDALGANVSSIFNESIRPGIEDRSTFSGQFGGPQSADAMGSATAPLSRAIADAEVNMFNADQDRALQALGIAPSIISGQLMPSQITSAVGADRTSRGQLELEDIIQMYEADRTNQLRGAEDSTGLFNQLEIGRAHV